MKIKWDAFGGERFGKPYRWRCMHLGGNGFGAWVGYTQKERGWKTVEVEGHILKGTDQAWVLGLVSIARCHSFIKHQFDFVLIHW
jgi:hypothetical protein